MFVWDSGINSWTTTYIIAPAAKESKNGRRYLTLSTKSAPITPAIGSTIPLRLPIINDLVLDNPSRLNGTETAVPSGKFWSPIPKASRQVAPSVTPSSPYFKEPKATPTANPSGWYQYVK